jgi:BirA family transcriptional regulator, biotin operon repressor / biotin---[acetyl-CoA-carboxylase] ligase
MRDRALLDLISEQAISGVVLSQKLGIGRSAVWKRIEQLRAAGFDIETKAGQGYFINSRIQWLDEKKITAGLSAKTKKLLGTIHIREQVDSTNAWAQTEKKNKAGCDVFLAEQQTAGRGRRGRAWVSPMAANIYLTLRHSFDKGLPAMSGLSLAVGMLVAKALRELGFSMLGVKWPNDIMTYSHQKCGGILIEVQGDVQGPVTAIIGIGLNVQMPKKAADEIDQAWTDLQSLLPQQKLCRNALIAALLNQLLSALQHFESKGLVDFVSEWPQYDVLMHQSVKVIDGVSEHEGIVLGVAENGALRLQEKGLEKQYYSGEISVRAL